MISNGLKKGPVLKVFVFDNDCYLYILWKKGNLKIETADFFFPPFFLFVSIFFGYSLSSRLNSLNSVNSVKIVVQIINYFVEPN